MRASNAESMPVIPPGQFWRLFRLALIHRWRVALTLLATAAFGAVTGSLLFFIDSLWKSWSAVQANMNGEGDPAQAAQLIQTAVDGMTTIAWQAALLAPVAGLLAYIAWYAGQQLANEMMRDLRLRFVRHLIALELAYHDQLARGELLARMTSDLDRMRGMMRTIMGRLIIRPVEILGLMTVMVYMNWRLGLLLVAVMVPVGLVAVRLVRRTRQRSAVARASQEKVFTDFEQITAGIRVVKSMGSTDREVERYGAANDRFAEDNRRLSRTRAQSEAVTEASIFMFFAAAMGAGAWLFSAKLAQPSELVLMIGAAARMATSIREMQRSLSEIIEGQPIVARVFQVLDRTPALADLPGAPQIGPLREGIRFENVFFRYDPDSGDVLRGVNLMIPAGKTTALVGQSGGGKTTLLDLIPRLREVTGGRITWDGQDVRGVSQESLIGSVAMVSQEAFLFDDTIRANIRYGRPEADDDMVEMAARRAHVHEAILSLEGGLGYDTRVGDRGGRLSGGQRQRIAIARALLRNAPILLMDEPTSALDAHSEHHVQLALQELMKGRTVVVIAHRLATVQHADVIHVIAGKDDPNPGRVLESGSHGELVAKGGAYADLAARQRLD